MNIQTTGSAVQRESLALYQPIVDAQTHCVVGCALVLGRSSFTPEDQESPQEIELQVWIDALTCLQACRKQGSDLSLLAPVSESQLHSPTFTAQLMGLLEQLQIPACCIELEISERVAMGNTSFMVECLSKLRKCGFSIVIDKLGSGYSTVSQWLDTPSTGIRIDEALTRRAQAKGGAALIEAILKIASICGLRTIAAGVQDADAAAVLALLGVERLQGEYFGHAMDCQTFKQRLSVIHHDS
jgi:EAL domain-containing protein (putative c-di-GMP-specific phosphodiesterase class I)